MIDPSAYSLLRRLLPFAVGMMAGALLAAAWYAGQM